jgi:hypothetical protein
MTKLRFFRTIGWLLLGVLVLATTCRAQTRPPIVEQLAKTYGLDSFGQIEAVRYTFNIAIPSLKLNLSRSWTWEPKSGQVTYEGKDKDGKPVKATYIRSQLNGAPANVTDVIDPNFVNDQYWLLLPFHVYWDSSADVQDMGMQKLPSGKGSAKQVVVKYPSEGGYSSGDTWELYLGPDNRIVEMVYRRGGPKKAGPLLISTEHSGTADGKPVHLSFSNVAVKLEGSDKWVNAR